MRRKIRSRRGFTLVEVLAVAAVILILLAIAIPSVMGAIDRGRHKHDAEFERAAMVLANGLIQTNSVPVGAGGKPAHQFLYDPDNGKLVVRIAGSMDLTPYPLYGECRSHNHAGTRLWVQIAHDTGKIELCWTEKLSGTSEAKWNDNLCDPPIDPSGT